jgi:hypothetical protein
MRISVQRSRGIGSLAEIAIAIVIISVGILSTLALLRASHKTMILSREYVSGEAVAIELVEKLKIVPYERLNNTSGFVDVGAVDSLLSLEAVPNDLVDVKRMVSIKEDDCVKTVSVSVTWKTKGKEGHDAEGSRKYFFFKTMYF